MAVPLVQLTKNGVPLGAPASPSGRKPSWLKVKAPETLQELRRLPRVAQDEPVPSATWGDGSRTLFGCGSLLVLAGIVASAYFGYHWMYVGDTEKPDQSLFFYTVDIDKVTPSDSMKIWEEAEKGLSKDRQMPAYLFARALSWRLISLMGIGGGLIIAGIAACIWASVMAMPGGKEKPKL